MAFDTKDLDLMALRTSDLKDYYKFVYKCSKCKYRYGSDTEEKPKQIKLCPICLGEFTNPRISRGVKRRFC